MTVLSIPTWLIHISSVIEWVVALWFVWIYADVSQNPAWKGFAIAMLPSLVSAMCACTWHFFDNAPQLTWLVTLQAATTVLGNTTLCLAAANLWRRAQISPR
jgi:chromate transport protein ChrA